MLSTPLHKAIRTTSQHLRRLKELGIETVSDLLGYFPRRYTDQRQVRRILEVELDAVNTVRGKILTVHNKPGFRGRMSIATALLIDESGTIEAVWFNQPYLAKILKVGEEVMLSGKVKYNTKKGHVVFQNPVVEVIKTSQIHMARIVPVYPETELDITSNRPCRGRLSSKWLREKIFSLLPHTNSIPDIIPESIRHANRLIPEAEAIKQAHFPSSEKALESAKRRLAFEELFILQLAALYRRQTWQRIAQKEQKQIPPNWDLIKRFTESLPFPLTKAQKKAIYEICSDLSKLYPMSRLLEGDTGSGKTVVAAASVLQTIHAGYQALVLAPTEILARQHMETFEKVLRTPFGIESRLLLGSTAAKEKLEIISKLKDGSLTFVIGTHALLQEKIGFKRLGLAIIDEQHRFGVKQREVLRSQGSPHVLNLTATPIPRTLALLIYGEQDLSVLDEMPPGRQKIITRIVHEEKRSAAYNWIAEKLREGRQAFIIFPLIEESELLEVKAAVSEWQRLRTKIFPQFSVGLLHGQLPPKEKDAIMANFAAAKLDILVSTSVVEVGVDVPNATIMMIEGAERFGLAQLHQFRGRVGRGSGPNSQSYCLLFHSSNTPQSFKRLQSLVKYHSGFKLAEIDLQLRGPGEVYGTSQSGLPDLKMASFTDTTTIQQARASAQMLIIEDPELKNYPELKEKILEQENIAIDY